MCTLFTERRFSHSYSAYHHSHPTLTERLRALDGYKSAAAKAKDETEKKEL